MRADNDNRSTLPYGLAPRGFKRTEAAAYIGVSASLFDEMVKDGRMPTPKRINTRTVWDRLKIEIAFDALPDEGEANPWDDDMEYEVGQVPDARRKRRN
ncbi:helix-turn-helix transcriptional regulator [Phyllobacterium zundukense]|uniref:Uncharacterized protein n=1 Tax=Phyllobacterium zundukense TaxID=1867719 RepID=A0A2N9VS64_9HYPH|nr:hypothetical protein [Phyllobacterium zundukense]ATU92755.1 hypothetical protein BLM14_14795 [Phyllobacterium zundukense]PIO42332.1 hypothetical protein B5P45_25250 [Phyllobacterium zundukense]